MAKDNALTTQSQVSIVPAKVSLMDVRMDSRNFPRLCTIPRGNAIADMSRIVTMAFMYKGQNADPVNVKFISTSLLDELMEDAEGIGTRFITLEEIRRVVKNAILTTDVYGVSVASLYRLVADYCKGEGHQLEKEAAQRKRINNESLLPIVQAYAGEMIRKAK